MYSQGSLLLSSSFLFFFVLPSSSLIIAHANSPYFFSHISPNWLSLSTAGTSHHRIESTTLRILFLKFTFFFIYNTFIQRNHNAIATSRRLRLPFLMIVNTLIRVYTWSYSTVHQTKGVSTLMQILVFRYWRPCSCYHRLIESNAPLLSWVFSVLFFFFLVITIS
jgi:hypothetical protein